MKRIIALLAFCSFGIGLQAYHCALKPGQFRTSIPIEFATKEECEKHCPTGCEGGPVVPVKVMN